MLSEELKKYPDLKHIAERYDRFESILKKVTIAKQA